MLPALHTPARAVVLAALLGASALAVPTAVRAQSVTAERALMSTFPPSQPGTLAALAHAQVTHVPADWGLIDALKPPSEPATPSVRLPFEATLAGARNGSTVWEGRLRGDASAPVELTLHQVESPVQAANPVWHVRGQWTVAGLVWNDTSLGVTYWMPRSISAPEHVATSARNPVAIVTDGARTWWLNLPRNGNGSPRTLTQLFEHRRV